MGWMLDSTRTSRCSWLAFGAVALAGTLVAAPPAQGKPPSTTAWQIARGATVRVLAGYEVEFTSNHRHQFVGSHGSGFFVGPSGYIATNAHVIDDARLNREEARHMVLANVVTAAMYESSQGMRTPENMLELSRGIAAAVRIVRRVAEVVLPGGERVPYEIHSVGSSAETQLGSDVAVLKVDRRPHAFVSLGPDITVKQGKRIRSWGYPTPADGPESAFVQQVPPNPRPVSARLGTKVRDDGLALRVLSSVSEGSSGGPAFNRQGQLLGLMTFGARCEESTRAIIPVSVVARFLEQAERNRASSLPRASLGPMP